MLYIIQLFIYDFIYVTICLACHYIYIYITGKQWKSGIAGKWDINEDFRHENQDIVMQPRIWGYHEDIAGGLGFQNGLDLIAI